MPHPDPTSTRTAESEQLDLRMPDAPLGGRVDELTVAVLDAIPAPTAILDPQGIVRLVNHAWTIANGPRPGEHGVSSLGHLPEVAAAVQCVLDGTKDDFATDYQDHGAWTSLRIRSLHFDGCRGAVMSRTDITEQVGRIDAATQLQAQWEATFDVAAIGMCLVDADGRFILVNRKMVEMFGREAEELLTLRTDDVAADGDRGWKADVGPLTYEERVELGLKGVERRYRRPDGTTFWTHATWSPVPSTSGHIAFMQLQDITSRKQAEARLSDHQALLELVAGGAPAQDVLTKVVEVGERHIPATWVAIAGQPGPPATVTAVGPVDALAEIEAAYRAYAPTRWRDSRGLRVLPNDGGSTMGAALGIAGAWLLPVLGPNEAVAGFLVAMDPPQEVRKEDRALVEQLGSVVRIAMQRDATTQEAAERLLEDALTGLPSRMFFDRCAEEALSRVGRGSRGVAVLSIDLDRFGRINESLGHVAGDDVLVQVAERLRQVTGPADTVARAAGDQFFVLLEDVARPDDALTVADRIGDVLRRPVVVDGVEFGCPASIGVVHRTEAGTGAESLAGDAALAMASAKSRGRDRAQLFSPDLREAHPRLTLERELARGVVEEQFVVYFQPEVDLESNRIVGLEALVRWDHPERGLLQPNQFIAAAEDSGAIVAIGRMVLLEACARLASWSVLEQHRHLTVSVNLSARQLGDPGLVDLIRDTLAEHELEPARLVLEMTESTLVDDTERAAEVFAALRQLGVSIAIDDFGTGYSSLVYLKRFPADMLKIDRSFVDGLGTDAGDSAIVAAVVRLAHRLDLTVVAEGVETDEQLAHLRRLGCEQGQGFLWSEALLGDDIEALLRSPLAEIATSHVASFDHGDGDRSELDELLAVLTHELSTPLTVIGGYAEMLATRLDADIGARTGVAAIERNVHNLGQLVAALADARGLGAGGTAVPFDAVAFVGQAMADLTPILSEHVVDLRLTSRAAPVLADPVGLSQILTNLIGNSTKFSPPGTTIEVAVETDGRDVRIEVLDHGEGVPPERVGELFGRFARLGSGHRGLGLGLYLSRAIARRLSGDIEHVPTPGGGATFVVTLPLRQENR